MHYATFTAAGLATIAASVSASSVQVNNYCDTPCWITLVNSTYGSSQFELGSGQAWVENISGAGNSLGLTKTADYWSSSTPKLILGTTIDSAKLWWSVNDVYA